MIDRLGLKRFREWSRASISATAAVVRLTWRASPPLVLAILVLVLFQALLPPIQLALTKLVIDRAALDLVPGSVGSGLATRLPLVAWIALAAGAVILGQLFEPFSRTLQSIVGDRLTGYLSEQIIRAANRWQGLVRFEDPTFADDLQRVRESAKRSGLQLLLFGASAFISLFTSVGLTVVLARLHPLAPLALLLASAPQMAQWWSYRARTGNHLYVKAPAARRLLYYRQALLRPESAKDVRLYALGSYFQHHYDETFDETTQELNSIRRRGAAGLAVAAGFSGGVAGAIYVYIVTRVVAGSLSAGDLVLYGGATLLLQQQLLFLSGDLSFLPMYYGAYLLSLFRVLDAPPDLPVPAAPLPVPHAIGGGIVFEHVVFSYPGAERPILRDVSFSMRPGEGLALVGHNGAGKTTIVKLLLRMYDPTAGRILLDGVDLRAYDVDDLRRTMGVIFQDFVRYELTAGENIAMGQIEAMNDDARLLEAAAKAGARELIAALPAGLRTELGREFGGRELSGGEWQKLALARAFARDCRLLVLDEPTAALDVQTEYDVYTRFYDLTRGRMTLLISHRFSTVRMADRILMLGDGRIAEQGSHAELIARAGEYARLYALQASQYLDPATEVDS